jgi:hypothetical protein
VVQHLGVRLVQRAAPRQPVDRHAHRDLPQPAGEALGVAQLRQLRHAVQEHLLRQLLRLRRVAQPRQRHRVHGRLEALDQLPVGRPVAGLRLLHQALDLDPGHRGSTFSIHARIPCTPTDSEYARGDHPRPLSAEGDGDDTKAKDARFRTGSPRGRRG